MGKILSSKSWVAYKRLAIFKKESVVPLVITYYFAASWHFECTNQRKKKILARFERKIRSVPLHLLDRILS